MYHNRLGEVGHPFSFRNATLRAHGTRLLRVGVEQPGRREEWLEPPESTVGFIGGAGRVRTAASKFCRTPQDTESNDAQR